MKDLKASASMHFQTVDFFASAKNKMEILQNEIYAIIENNKILVENAMKAGQDKNIGHEYIKDIETKYRENNRSPIPTPWDDFNNLLQGGLGGGDFGLVFGNPGGG